MGQKINPLGFRLGTTQSHHSLWFAQPKEYSEGLQEDQPARAGVDEAEAIKINFTQYWLSVSRNVI